MSLSHQIETALAQDQGKRAAELLTEHHKSGQIAAPELQAIGEAVARQYRDFHTHPVHEFYAVLEREWPAAAYQAVYAPIQADFDATRTWDRRLDEIAS